MPRSKSELDGFIACPKCGSEVIEKLVPPAAKGSLVCENGCGTFSELVDKHLSFEYPGVSNLVKKSAEVFRSYGKIRKV